VAPAPNAARMLVDGLEADQEATRHTTANAANVPARARSEGIPKTHRPGPVGSVRALRDIR
jgi:hypothetical protein